MHCDFGCPHSCHCDMAYHTCSNKKLERIPEYLHSYESPRTLDVSHNEMTTIAHDWFSSRGKTILGKQSNAKFIYLLHLNLSHNKIEEINDRSFMIVLNLKTLDLSHNPLRSFEEDHVQNIKNLIHLDLSYTYIKFVDFANVAKFNELIILKLSNTKIKTLDVDHFADLESLREIELPHYAFCCKLKEARNTDHMRCTPIETKLSTCKSVLRIDPLRKLLIVLSVFSLFAIVGAIFYSFKMESDEIQKLLIIHFLVALLIISISYIIQAISFAVNHSRISTKHKITSSLTCKAASAFYLYGHCVSLLGSCHIGLYALAVPLGFLKDIKHTRKILRISLTLMWIFGKLVGISVLAEKGSISTYFSEIDALCLPISFLLDQNSKMFIYGLIMVPVLTSIFTLINFGVLTTAVCLRLKNIITIRRGLKEKAKVIKDEENVYNLWKGAVFEMKSNDIELVASFTITCSTFTFFSLLYAILGKKKFF